MTSGGDSTARAVKTKFLVLLQMELEHADVRGAAFVPRNEGGEGAQDFLAPGERIGQGRQDVSDEDGQGVLAAGGGIFFVLLFVFWCHNMKLRYMK
jgi:hypothetical protein